MVFAMQIFRDIILLTKFTLPPISMTTSRQSPHPPMEQVMISRVLTNDKFLVDLWPVMVDFRFWWEWFTKSFFRDKNVFQKVSVAIGSRMFGHQNHRISVAVDGSPALPCWSVAESIVRSATIVSIDILSGFSLCCPPSFIIGCLRLSFTAATALTKSFGNFLNRGIFGISHSVFSFQEDGLMRAEGPLTRFFRSFFYIPSLSVLEGLI